MFGLWNKLGMSWIGASMSISLSEKKADRKIINNALSGEAGALNEQCFGLQLPLTFDANKPFHLSHFPFLNRSLDENFCTMLWFLWCFLILCLFSQTKFSFGMCACGKRRDIFDVILFQIYKIHSVALDRWVMIKIRKIEGRAR